MTIAARTTLNTISFSGSYRFLSGFLPSSPAVPGAVIVASVIIIAIAESGVSLLVLQRKPRCRMTSMLRDLLVSRDDCHRSLGVSASRANECYAGQDRRWSCVAIKSS